MTMRTAENARFDPQSGDTFTDKNGTVCVVDIRYLGALRWTSQGDSGWLSVETWRKFRGVFAPGSA